MFDSRELSAPVAAVKADHAPDAIVFDSERDFETLPPEQAEELGFAVDSLELATYPSAWLPADAPTLLERYAGADFTVGMPGDGSVVWTRQTEPPVVLVKPRVQGSPESFVDFLLAEAFVELGLEIPEHFLDFFEDGYRDLDRAVSLDANSTYQIAAALYDGWVGLQTREVFATWPNDSPELAAAWQDAGDRLEGRVSGLPSAVARNETDFADATELACAAIKHAIELPAPFAALDTEAYLDHGPEYAIRWAEKTFDALTE
ncbi:DUF7089 family protein [Natrarchaeobaculum sulfurireducens]|uniref:Uncharacterized protein n=1 Tax=Natrarchaeobaculum sulfurireducens TaxID=2044521 RepID=A0A346PJX6_9EURY|nr:hypothetical protein [Natrarchaeobaculum sulfurireducens]AXR79821.1 hypothetical protein AArc1_3529 [Natrarchaeobaculum sulfurireducens]